MRKIKLIPVVAIIALFVSILSSCGESESARKQDEKVRQIERQKQITDSTTKAEADSVKARAERPYDFVPEIVMATKEIEKMDLCGEGQYKCQTYSADIYFYSDSTNESSKHRLRLSYNVSVDTKETYKEEMESLAEMKKAYTKIINTEAKNLIVTYNPKTNRMVIRENLPLQQRKNIGKALLMEEVNDLIWQDSY
jgi:protein required for attachment to host cells